MRPQQSDLGWLASLVQLRFLPYPERYSKTETLEVEAPVFQAPINSAIF